MCKCTSQSQFSRWVVLKIKCSRKMRLSGEEMRIQEVFHLMGILNNNLKNERENKYIVVIWVIIGQL